MKASNIGRFLVILSAGLLVSACNEGGIVAETSPTPTAVPPTPTPATPTPTPTPVSFVQENFYQGYAFRAVDVLWVIDNSGSMGAEQTNLANAFDNFIPQFIDLDLDFHLGVVTTDMADSNESGKLQAPVGEPTFLTPQTPNLIDTFKSRVNVGTTGGFAEKGLQASQAALSEPLKSGHNVDFLRDDAVLAVLYLSDEDDQSPGSWADYVYFFDGLKADPSKINVSAIVGDVPGGCATASAGPRYHEVANSFGGLTSSICAADFSDALVSLSDIVASLAAGFPLQYLPIPGTLEVTVDGVVIPGGSTTWSYNPASNEIVFQAEAVPLECQDLSIAYALAPGQGVTEPTVDHPIDPACTN